MKYTAIIMGFALMFGACSQGADVTATPELTSQDDSFSYYYGIMVGDDIKTSGSENFDNLDMDLLVQGFNKAVIGQEENPTNMEEVKAYFFARINEIKMEQAAKEQAAAPDPAVAAQAIVDWITANRTMDDFTKAPEGYYYREITAGSGAKPAATDRVSVHYTGTLLNGTVFDSSIPRNEPAEFGLNQVIKGWTLGLQNMNEGSKYEFVFPPELAYGSRAAGDDIPANSTLVFEVELLKIIK